ncbi:DUF3575 domain-containing protein [Marinilongibacter aquaticus]|uniref:DUF3575 domain-containing protein n=1 Tax=Marinilongibacter aquaticus TaxID=2975157 RepID=UPI0021BDC73C|nr:DUF3575 domain-containing protein [Marinilongibacter aquaticus]UBM60920.1 DUF3575 domain-containing protein [Marinilongibacter aquaticus]
MKKLLFTLLLAMPCLSFAQLDIKLNLPSTVGLKPELGLEFGYDNFSLEIDNGLILQKWGEATFIDSEGNEVQTGVNRFGYNGGIRANYYFSPRETLDGWFVSPVIKYRSQKIKFEDPIKNKRVGAGLVLGRKGMIFDRFGYAAEGGFGYWFINSYKNSQGENSPIYKDSFLFADLLEKLDKFMLPFTVTLFYRIGS